MTRLLYLPLSVLSASFLILCVHSGTAWPWNVVVHEDGRRTLLDTVFYFEHALGKLPLDLLLSAAVAGAMLSYSAPPAATSLAKLAAVCLAIDLVIVAGAVLNSGPKVAASYLFQFHTRENQPMVYGSHWRYYLLGQAALMLLPMAFVRKRNLTLLTAWSLFVALTIIFGVNRSSFIDPRSLGHQARELFTHTLVTIPLALAVVTSGFTVRCLNFNWTPVAFLLLCTYLAAGVVLTGALHQSQSSDWTSAICAHFFEHTFSYLVVPAHAQLFYLLGARHA